MNEFKNFLAFCILCPNEVLTAVLIPLLIFLWSRVGADKRPRVEWILVLVIAAEPAQKLAPWVASCLGRFVPWKYDLYVYAIDCHLGLPGFHLAEFAARHLWCTIVLDLSYGLLPLSVPAAIAAYLWWGTLEEARNVALTFLLNFLAAVPLYLCLPVCGPIFAFPRFPQIPALLSAHPILLHATPNGVPSVHMSTALLVLWFVRRWPWPRRAAFVFAGLTVLATLGTGQHYSVDLLAAVPYAALIVYATRTRSAPKLVDVLLYREQLCGLGHSLPGGLSKS